MEGDAASQSEESGNLWEKVKGLAQGIRDQENGPEDQKKEAVELLWNRSHELPDESVELLLNLADKKEPKEVRKAIAQKLVPYKSLHWGMYIGALEILSDDTDDGIRDLVRKSLPGGWVNKREVRALRMFAVGVVAVLLVFLLVSAALSIFTLSMIPLRAGQPDYEVWAVLLSVAAGTLGSSVAAMISVLDRVSHGWELDRGEKWPPFSKYKDKFVARMIPWFCVRPLLGSVMGLLMYAGVVGGYLVAVRGMAPTDFSPHGLAFLALLAGLFAKTFLEKLREGFKTFLDG